MSIQEVILLMRAEQGKRTATEYAASLGVSSQYLSSVYKGNCAPGPGMLRALGLEKVLSYRKIA